MYASHNFQQELSTYNYGHTFRKLAVSKHVRLMEMRRQTETLSTTYLNILKNS